MSSPGVAQPAPGGPDSVVEERGVKGRLRISRYAHGPGRPDGGTFPAGEPLRHVSVLARGPGYEGMEDNDVRGMLDGTFFNGWNQPGQHHVRVGRLRSIGQLPKYGEHEIFRVLMRWAEIGLPEGAQVHRGRLTLRVEEGCGHALRLMLYRVQKDWNPGMGGTQRDSTSPPNVGEVWWNDVAFAEVPWGLPGAGFASRERADADTDAMPLADACYRPGDRHVAFRSTALDRYLSERIAAGRPLLFLLKVADVQEDVPGAGLSLYSANYGPWRSRVRRPRLKLEWSSGLECWRHEGMVFLEHGRCLVLPPFATPSEGPLAVSFARARGYRRPVIEVRDLDGETPDWRVVDSPVVPGGRTVQLRLTAASDPVALGAAFTATLRHPWVISAPPEEQLVTWSFLSPSGLRREVVAEYLGDYRWRAWFVPDEPGRWVYRWTDRFHERPSRGPLLRFDVVARDASAVVRQLGSLRSALAAGPTAPAVERLRFRFTRLERAALQLQTPETFRSEEGEELRRALDEVRTLLWGRPLPDPLPLKPHPRREWQRNGREQTLLRKLASLARRTDGGRRVR